MGIYSTALFEGAQASSYTVDDLMNDSTVSAAVEESAYEASLRAVAESTYNWNAIMEACTIEELRSLNENGSVDVLYEAGGFKGVMEAIKNFFKKIWEKIQEIVKKAVMFFNSHAKNDKDFYNKYKKEITIASRKTLPDTDVKFFDYVFYDNISDWESALTTVTTQDVKGKGEGMTKLTFNKEGADWAATETYYKNEIKDNFNEDKITEILDTFRGSCVAKLRSNGSTTVSANEFGKALKEAIQGGETIAPTKKLAEAFAVVSDGAYLSDSAKIKTHLNTILKNAKTAIDKDIKFCENANTELTKVMGTKEEANEDKGKGKAAGAATSYYQKIAQILKSEREITVQFIGASINGLKAASAQAKTIIAKAVFAKEKKIDESFVQTESSVSLLDSIKLM